jgi:predicted phosphodiesterase
MFAPSDHGRVTHYRRPTEALSTLMPGQLIRILSDVHYGDHASRVVRLSQLRPLLDGVTQLILNGDTLDTRPGPLPAHTAECCAIVSEFFSREVAVSTFLTGNHDADFSPHHHLDLAGGQVFVTHGDIFFDNIVPWSRDAALISRRIAEELRSLPGELHEHLDHRLALLRRVAASIPQRHQSERSRLKYALHYLADTVWPPLRTLRVMHAWRLAPTRAVELARRHRPAARFVLAGHTHRPGIWRRLPGITVINTGSFCPPLGGYAVDLEPERLTVRRVSVRAGEFHPGDVVAEFPLAAH